MHVLATYLLVPPLPPKTLDRGDWQEPRNGLSGTAWTHTTHSVDHKYVLYVSQLQLLQSYIYIVHDVLSGAVVVFGDNV